MLKKIFYIDAMAITETTLLICVLLLVFVIAQPYVSRAMQGYYRRTIGDLKEPPSFTVAISESDNYVHPTSSGYDIINNTFWKATLTDYFESNNQTIAAGNTTIFYSRKASFSGVQSEPPLNKDNERINCFKR